MNAQSRAKLAECIKGLEELNTKLTDLKNEEEDKIANMPESMSESDQVADMQTAVDNIDSAISDLENAVAALNDVP